MAEAPTEHRRDAYERHPYEASCGYSSECTNSLECPFDPCPGETATYRRIRRDTEDLPQKAMQLRQQGMEPRVIADALGVSHRTVFRYLSKAD